MSEFMRVQKFFTKPSLTKASFKDECDINLIMKKFRKVCDKDYLEKFAGVTGGFFGDFSQIPDYMTAQNRMKDIEKTFLQFPSKVRAMFHNSVAQFMDSVLDPAQTDELIRLGILTKTAVDTVEQPVKAEQPTPAAG